jgi:hypothetical protein
MGQNDTSLVTQKAYCSHPLEVEGFKCIEERLKFSTRKKENEKWVKMIRPR